MDRGLFIVAVFFIVFGLPVILGTMRKMMKQKLRLKERELELLSHQTAEKAAQYAAHVERLENRVRVLERIATDKGTVLADEIESLRDRPLN
jgi:uncharacterized protein YlxW (UPF0749 family)